MSKISIVIPAYRVEKQLERCIRSVIGQTYPDLEILLIDDGSTDGTAEICDRFAAKDERIVVIHQPNGGVSVARNHALRAVTGEYLLFLDGDDAWDPECVATCVRETENGKWDIVMFGFHIYLETGGDVRLQNDIVYSPAAFDGCEELQKQYLFLCKNGLLDFVTDKLIRTSLVHDHELEFNSAFNVGGEDAMFMMSLFPFLSGFKVTDHVFYQYYRRSDASITLTFRPDKFARYTDRLVFLFQQMRRFDCLDRTYLMKQYGVYFLWSYESMLSATCKLTFRQRREYIRKEYRMKTLFEGQKKEIKALLKQPDVWDGYCSSSRVALRLFYRRHTGLLWLWQLLTLFRTGRRK